jgi:hypothetical protein
LYLNIPQPETIGKNIKGVFYDGRMNVISRGTLIERIADQGGCFIKPALSFKTGDGLGTEKIIIPEITENGGG